MRKAVVLIIALLMTAGLCACNVTVSTPADTVDSFLKDLKSGDKEALMLYVDNSDVNTLINNTMDEKLSGEIYGDLMENLTWEIVSAEENEEQTEAIVVVSITNSDFSGVRKAYKKEAVDYMMYNLYDDDVTKKVMKAKCQEIFAQQIKNASEAGDNPVTTEVEVKLTKNDTYTWDMEVTKELTKAAIGGLKWP